jgi:farnesyl diphosphate synthase
MVGGDPLLAESLARIARQVDSMFDALLPNTQDNRAVLGQAMRHAALGGGKRLRPLLLTATAAMYGADKTQALRAAIAIEAVHVYSLVHDDLPCMDDDDLRRGKPTVHKAFGEAMAVLAGDALQAFAFEVLAAGAGGMVGGQVLDIAGEGQSLGLPEITRMQQLKTGALLGAAVEMGAALGKVPTEGRTHLRGYARDLGLAFQIADDLLDHQGDAAKAGKALRKDAEAGKQTFIALLGPERAREQAQMLVDQAVAHLAQHGQEAEVLRSLAHFVVERDH